MKKQAEAAPPSRPGLRSGPRRRQRNVGTCRPGGDLALQAAASARVLALLAALGPFVLLGGCGARAPSTKPTEARPVPRVPVVRTWGDLLRRTPVELGDGATARFGIEATRCPRWSGVLLYCLTEGWQPPGRWETGDRLGPLRVSVSRDGIGRAIELCDARTERPRYPEGCRLLFVRALTIPSPGKYEITLFTGQGRAVGAVAVRGTDEPFHPWLAWGDPRGSVGTVPRGPVRRLDPEGVEVGGPGDVVALPHWGDGMQPIPFARTAGGRRIERSESEPLPRLVPEGADPGLVLTVAGTTAPKSASDGLVPAGGGSVLGRKCRAALTVRSDVDIVTGPHPEWHFLARWWVNGRPYAPEEVLLPLSVENGLCGRGRELAFRATVYLEELEARRGDRIGLELLYCEAGVAVVGGTRAWTAWPDEPRGWFPGLTNRVEFVVP